MGLIAMTGLVATGTPLANASPTAPVDLVDSRVEVAYDGGCHFSSTVASSGGTDTWVTLERRARFDSSDPWTHQGTIRVERTTGEAGTAFKQLAPGMFQDSYRIVPEEGVLGPDEGWIDLAPVVCVLPQST